MAATDAVFAAATTATGWTRTNLGPRAEVRHGGYVWTVELPASGHGPARIVGRHGYGRVEYLDVEATWGQTAAVVDGVMAALRPC